MRRPEYLYLHEMRDAVVRIIDIVGTSSRAEIEQDRNRADALMWNYTVLGQAAILLMHINYVQVKQLLRTFHTQQNMQT